MTIRTFASSDSTALALGADDVSALCDADCYQGQSNHAPSLAPIVEIPYLKKQERLTLARDRCACTSMSERVQPGVAYKAFYFPESGADIITADNSDRATNCPEYRATVVRVKSAAALAT